MSTCDGLWAVTCSISEMRVSKGEEADQVQQLQVVSWYVCGAVCLLTVKLAAL